MGEKPANLFPFGRWTKHSGKVSEWKIECDALTWDEWDSLAWLASELVGPFAHVIGATGAAQHFASALEKYAHSHDPFAPLLICDDVLTTGSTMWKLLDKNQASAAKGFKGVVVFARGPLPYWVDALFTVDKRLWDK